ncbi:Plastocyanin, chloroplastic [Coccomyxa sp. Obi]|nr:Plastocyanin, chloroplastic [Coccomyxa sp. Obi]
MALSMKSSTAFGTRVVAPQKITVRARASPVVSATLREDVARYAKAAGVGIASLGLALSANAASVKLGGDGGALVFDPATVTIKAGESVTWTNNVGFPHNVVFDEDAVPAGVSADSLSHEDYLNAPGETVSSKFTTPGEYSYYCEPHQGAGMAGKVIVQ